MGAPVIGTFTGKGIDHPYTAAYAIRNWGITPELRALARQRCEDKLADKSAPWQEHKDAVRLLALLDSMDDKREWKQTAARQADMGLALADVRTRLAAQFASSLTDLAAVASGTVLPAVSPSLAPPVSGSTNTPSLPPVQCSRCQDATVLVTSRGTVPCPECGDGAPPADAAELALRLAY